jgi:hypothetical protein
MHRIHLHPLTQYPAIYPEGCRANCVYCGLAQHREETRDHADRNLIRVDWPAVHYEEIIARVKNGEDLKKIELLCISMISHPDSNDDIFYSSSAGLGKYCRFWRRSFSVPQCSITVPGADARSGRGYFYRGAGRRDPGDNRSHPRALCQLLEQVGQELAHSRIGRGNLQVRTI